MLLLYQLTSRKNYEEQQAANGGGPLKDNPFAADRMCILEQRWLGLFEQFRAFCSVDFRLDYAATIIGASALK